MKTGTAELIEGAQAFEKFRAAVKKIISVPKSALPPSPFKSARVKKKKPAPKG